MLEILRLAQLFPPLRRHEESFRLSGATLSFAWRADKWAPEFSVHCVLGVTIATKGWKFILLSCVLCFCRLSFLASLVVVVKAPQFDARLSPFPPEVSH